MLGLHFGGGEIVKYNKDLLECHVTQLKTSRVTRRTSPLTQRYQPKHRVAAATVSVSRLMLQITDLPSIAIDQLAWERAIQQEATHAAAS